MNLQAMKDLSPEKQKELFNRLTGIRKKAKTTTYSATYGVGKAKLARTAGTTEQEAQTLLDGFWKMNWAVKAFADDAEVKTVGGQMWVKNPVSNFWYTLRFEKDVFSTLNQGTGAYCFDTWLGYCMARGVVPCGQFHDEFVTALPKGQEKQYEEVLTWAIAKTNDKLKLNVELGIDVQFGDRYSEIH